MRQEFDVVVVGAGAVGAATAALLATRGVTAPSRIAVLDARLPTATQAADWDLRVFALSHASQRVLREIGAWERLPRSRVARYERMCVWDAAGAPGGGGSLTFDCAELGEPDLGSIVDGAELKWHCLQAARHAGVAIVEAGLRDVGVDAERVRILLNDGRELGARLIAAADGAESPSRRFLGIDTAGHPYGQEAIVCHLHTERPHRNTAWQRFLPTGPLALLPLSDGRSSIVWSVRVDEARRLRALDPAAFARAVDAASDGVLGATRLSTPIASHPLRLRYAQAYVGERAALLGDAAHVVHPLAGQGLNLGFLDGAALAVVLADASDAGSFGDLRVLRRYERWRKSENMPAAAAFDGLDRLFSNSDPLAGALRRAGLGLVGRSPLLRRWLAAPALGRGAAPTADRSSRRR
ncbi:MAG: FAD-dependent monooxygenase [Gammaproteobacteria bacterium]|nr:FAD-dependent monooxygenase [Gammaproteobacteria bacterium]